MHLLRTHPGFSLPSQQPPLDGVRGAAQHHTGVEMVHFTDSGNARDYPFRTEVRSVTTAVQQIMTAHGVPAAAGYLIDNYDDDAVLHAIAYGLVPPGSFTITPRQQFQPHGPAFDLFTNVVLRLPIEVWKDGLPYPLPALGPHMGGDPQAFAQAVHDGTLADFTSSPAAASNLLFEIVWQRYVWLLQVNLLMDVTNDRPAAVRQLEAAGEGLPTDDYTVVHAHFPAGHPTLYAF